MPSPKTPSAALVARRQAKVTLNHAALDALTMGIADGLADLGDAIIADASSNAPRDPDIAAKRGVPMMKGTGHWGVFVDGKQVSGEPGKPKGLTVVAGQVVLWVGFGSPLSHFAERGTIKEPPHPFLLPAVERFVPGTKKFVLPAMEARAAGAEARTAVLAAGGTTAQAAQTARKAKSKAWNRVSAALNAESGL